MIPGFKTLATALLVTLAVPAGADAPPAPVGPVDPRFHADVEVDPTAYVLDGYSLHAGLGWERWRLDLGAFALAVPDFVHGQDGFEQSFDGYGAKVQYFFFAPQRGLFAGLDAGVARTLVRLEGTDSARRDTQVSVGVNAGYRIEIAGGVYATPWVGVGYAVGAEDVTLGGKTFDGNPWLFFPAVHLGYHLR